jgi:hypothetical protein
MGTLQTAFTLLAEQYGEFDNVKLLLGGGDGMTDESVAAELLEIAQSAKAGEYPTRASFPEVDLADVKITR